MIDRLTVRADEVDVIRRESRVLERRQAGRGKRLADQDVQLGDRRERRDRRSRSPGASPRGRARARGSAPARPRPRPRALHPANGDVDRVGTRPGHQAHDDARRLAAPFQEVSKWMGHPKSVYPLNPAGGKRLFYQGTRAICIRSTANKPTVPRDQTRRHAPQREHHFAVERISFFSDSSAGSSSRWVMTSRSL